MKVILLQDIKKLGKKDDVIDIVDGYARNYLFPKNFAKEATRDNMVKLESKKDAINHKKELELEDYKIKAQQLKDITLKLFVKAGEHGKIFGGITSKEISEELNKRYKLNIDKKKIILNETIKTLGNFIIEVKFGNGITSKLNINVVSE